MPYGLDHPDIVETPAPAPAPTTTPRGVRHNGLAGRHSPARRAAMREMRLGYHAATVAREQGLAFSANTADYHLRADRKTLVNYSRALDRDNLLYNGMLTRLVDNTLGATGLTLQARTPDPDANALIERNLWPAFAEAPEIRGLFSWRSLEALALRDFFCAGDIGAIKLGTGQLQVIESENMDSGTAGTVIEQGVSLDTYGRPAGFYVASGTPATYRLISASDFVYLANLARATQTRGVPAFQSAFAQFQRINSVLDSEALAWQLLSRFAISITKEAAAESGYETSDDDDATETTNPTLSNRYSEVDEGLVFWGRPGEEIKGIEQNRPPESFGECLVAFLRCIGMQSGLPLELLLLDWSRVNFSSSRAALMQAYLHFSRWQRTLMRSWHDPIYAWQVSRWIAMGVLPDAPETYAHEWIPPAFPWVDPKAEADAAAVQMDRGLLTQSAALKQIGLDRDEQMALREAEVRDAIERAARIRAETGVEVGWEMFCGSLTGKTALAVEKKQAGEQEAVNGAQK